MIELRFYPDDLGLEDGDPGLELLDRQRIEVLPGEQGQRIVGLVREELVEVHRRRDSAAQPCLSTLGAPSAPFGRRIVAEKIMRRVRRATAGALTAASRKSIES